MRWAASRSRSPRRQAHGRDGSPDATLQHTSDEEQQLLSECLFCGRHARCDWGRDHEFCGVWCYTQYTVGRDAIEWSGPEVNSWLTKEGQLPHARVRLCRAGLPRCKARAMINSIQELRKGAWLQPEPPLAELPLTTIAVSGQRAGMAWKPVLDDGKHRSFAAWCPNAIDPATAWEWFEALRNRLPWEDLRDNHHQGEGRTIPRRTVFVVDKGCKCTYRYSGVTVPPFEEPDFIAEIRKRCVALAGMSSQPNACNINLYRNGMDSVGWHTDNEELYEAEYNDAVILSLTLGARRKFCIKRMEHENSHYESTKPSVLVLGHGDLCTMEGRFQRYYLHAVPKEPRVQEPRLNLTWRWITRHSHRDGCRLCGPGN